MCKAGYQEVFCSPRRKDGFSRATALGLGLQTRLGGKALQWWDQAGSMPWGCQGRADRDSVVSACGRPGIVAELEVQ